MPGDEFDDYKVAQDEDFERYKVKAPDVFGQPTGIQAVHKKNPITDWAADLKEDIRHGTDLTTVGKGLKWLGAKGLDTGVAPGAMDFSPGVGVMAGVPELIHGAGHAITGENEGDTTRGINEALGGAFKTAAGVSPFVGGGRALPHYVPSAAQAIPTQAGIRGGAEALGAEPETAELLSNLGLIALPGMKKAASPFGRTLSHNAEPIAKTAGAGIGLYEALHRSNPLYLGAAWDRITKPAAKLIDIGGKAIQKVGDAPLMSHELFESPKASGASDLVSSPSEARQSTGLANRMGSTIPGRKLIGEGTQALGPVETPESDSILKPAKSQIVKDPVTGQMKKVFLSGAAEEGEKPTYGATAESAVMPKTGEPKTPPRVINGKIQAQMRGPGGEVLDTLGLKSATERAALDKENGLNPTEEQSTNDFHSQAEQTRLFKEFVDKMNLANQIAREQGSTDEHGNFGPSNSFGEKSTLSPEKFAEQNKPQEGLKTQPLTKEAKSDKLVDMSNQPENPSRRNFLKKTGQAALGMAASKILPESKPLIDSEEGLTDYFRGNESMHDLAYLQEHFPGITPEIATSIRNLGDKIDPEVGDILAFNIEEGFGQAMPVRELVKHLWHEYGLQLQLAEPNDPIRDPEFKEEFQKLLSSVGEEPTLPTDQDYKPGEPESDMEMARRKGTAGEILPKSSRIPQVTGQQEKLEDQGINEQMRDDLSKGYELEGRRNFYANNKVGAKPAKPLVETGVVGEHDPWGIGQRKPGQGPGAMLRPGEEGLAKQLIDTRDLFNKNSDVDDLSNLRGEESQLDMSLSDKDHPLFQFEGKEPNMEEGFDKEHPRTGYHTPAINELEKYGEPKPLVDSTPIQDYATAKDKGLDNQKVSPNLRGIPGVNPENKLIVSNVIQKLEHGVIEDLNQFIEESFDPDGGVPHVRDLIAEMIDTMVDSREEDTPQSSREILKLLKSIAPDVQKLDDSWGDRRQRLSKHLNAVIKELSR